MGLNPRLIWLSGIAVFLGLLLTLIWHQDPDFWRSAHALFQSAQQAAQRGELQPALKYAQKAYKRQPANTGYGTFLGWLYLKAGQPQEALEVFRQVCSQQATATDALKGQAEALKQLGKHAAALNLLDTYLTNYPEDTSTLQFAANFVGRYQSYRPQALNYYRRLYQLNPHDPLIRRQLLDLLVELNHYEEAIPIQEAEVAEFPNNPQALHQLALLHYWNRDYQAAVPIYQRLLEIEADNQALRLEAAQVADAAQEVDQAITHYLRLYAQERGKTEYALALARLWSQKGNHAEAAAVLAPLMRGQPEPKLLRWRALELLLAGDHAQALKAYKAAWDGGDTHQETIVNLARLYAEQRQFAKAAAMWEEAERRQLIRGEQRWEAALTYSYAHRYREAVKILGPVDRQKNPQRLLFLGQMHFYQKHWDKAAQYYEAYLERHPQDVAVRVQLAEVLSYDSDTLDKSAQQYQEALKLKDDPQLRLRRAGVLLQQAQSWGAERDKHKREIAQQKWAEAEAELERCSPNPSEPELLREQARLYLWSGNLDNALAQYERYLAQVPNDRQAQIEKARVLIYLQRGPEAMEVLRRVPSKPPPEVAGEGKEKSNPELFDQSKLLWDRELQTAFIEAALANKDWGEANRLALRLYSSQFPNRHRLANDWAEARRWSQEAQHRGKLSLEERTWVARALCHHPDLETTPAVSREAVDLLIDNLYTKGITRSRHYHATLLMLAYLMPRLTHYDDLRALIYRIPRIRVGSPEYIASLCFFTSKLGRHGGRLDYLQNVLKERRRRHRPRNPADLVYLANLAIDLGDPRSAEYYYRQALKLRPQDQRLAALRMQNLMAMQDFGKVLKVLESQPQRPETRLEMAQVYLYRRQYEGAIAMLSDFPASHSDRPRALLMLAQAYRSQGNYQQALQTLELLETQDYRKIKNPAVASLAQGGDHSTSLFNKTGSPVKSTSGKGGGQGISQAQLLMEKAQTLEAMADQGAARAAYQQIIHGVPDSQVVRVAQARLARLNGNWSAAYKKFAAALQQAPQDRQLLNELEDIRQRMRPQIASRGFSFARGQRRPEEAMRPAQFSRFDREPRVSGRFYWWPPMLQRWSWRPEGLGLSNYLPGFLVDMGLPVVPQLLWFEDSNKIYGGMARLSGSFWISKVLPLELAAEYREYNQNIDRVRPGDVGPGVILTPDELRQVAEKNCRWRRAEVSLGLGPLPVGERVQISGEIIARRYWKRIDRTMVRKEFIGPGVSVNKFYEITEKDHRDRLFGSLEVNFPVGASIDFNIKYSRRDLFDQEAHVYPRLYQSVLDLQQFQLTTLHQAEISHDYRFRPGWAWRGNLGAAQFSDHNQRLTLYQGLSWQAVHQPRMHLELTPHLYVAAYRRGKEAYFSPGTYRAFGLGLDFDRQIFRLPTLILQGTGQAVGQHSEWGPALQGLAALEWEFLQNFYTNVHVFYFKEWVDNYRLLNVGFALGCRF
ncbi:MAG: tetratricopeptide repeat protein [Deltaproteobacteria bacterium]|nr:tetratricopeptide repeat protein [Deltaproteobacteria bacterium]